MQIIHGLIGYQNSRPWLFSIFRFAPLGSAASRSTCLQTSHDFNLLWPKAFDRARGEVLDMGKGQKGLREKVRQMARGDEVLGKLLKIFCWEEAALRVEELTDSDLARFCQEVDELKAGARRQRRCANAACNFQLHQDSGFGGYCCKQCHLHAARNGLTKRKKNALAQHGGRCCQISCSFRRALPKPPDHPQAAAEGVIVGLWEAEAGLAEAGADDSEPEVRATPTATHRGPSSETGVPSRMEPTGADSWR
eukprot:g30956.t1